MANESEKITVNLGIVDLAQIDVLVDQGLYASRSDFIRLAIRKEIGDHKEEIKQSLKPIVNESEWSTYVGIMRLSEKDFENLKGKKQRLKLTIIGMLIIDSNVNTDLLRETVEALKIRGKLVASDEIKQMINEMN